MSVNYINARLMMRYNTEEEWADENPLLLAGEVAFSTDKGTYKVGDGVSNWNDLKYAADIHTHSVSQISDFPSGLKNPYALTVQFNSTNNTVYDGSAAKTVNITPSAIGAATEDHTHENYLLLTGGTISGNLTVSGTLTATASKATALATGRTIQTNLASSTAATFDGTANIQPGITGVLPIANGGTGTTTGHVAVTKDADSTSTASPASGGSFTVIDGIGRDTNGHVTTVNTKTVTLPTISSTDVNVTNTLATTTKAYVTGTTSSTTNTGTQVFDTGVYLGTTAGELVATTFTGNATSATKLATGRIIQTNLGSTSSATFNGTENITPGVTGTLGIANGGTGTTTGHVAITMDSDTTSAASPSHGGTFTVVDGIGRDTNGHVTSVNTKTVTLPSDNNTDTKVTQSVSTTSNYRPVILGATNTTDTTALTTSTTSQVYVSSPFYAQPSTGTLYATTFSGNATSATKLATERTIQTNLGSTSSASFNGTVNITPGVTGTLGIANGGTGTTTGHAAITMGSDTTSSASPAHGGTFTVVDGIGRDDNGHVTTINTKTVTLPSDNNTDTKVTQTITSTAASYPVLLAPSGQTASTTTTAYFGTGLQYNPSTKVLSTTTFSGALSGNATTATTLAATRTLTTNLASTTAANFNGSENASIGVTGTLGITNGGTGTTTGHIAVTKTTDTTATKTLSFGGTFSAVTGATRDTYGHVTTLETTTYTLPSTTVITDGDTSIGGNTQFVYMQDGSFYATGATIGSGTKPIYMSAGVMTASSSTVGTAAKFIYMQDGVLTATTSTIGSTTQPVYMNAGVMTAMTGSVGSSTSPIYMDAGVFKQCSSLNASTISLTTTNPDTVTEYYVPFSTGSGTVLRINNGIKYRTLEGTTSATGYGELILGNSTASGTAANKYGWLVLYGTGANYWSISGSKSISANYTLYLPASGGCLVAATDSAATGGTAKPVYISSSGVATALTATVGSGVKPVYLSSGTITVSSSSVGSSTQPVYLSSGTITAMGGALAVAYGGTGNTTGTATYVTTTADTTNTLYLVGVTSDATTTLKRDTSITIVGDTINAKVSNIVGLTETNPDSGTTYNIPFVSGLTGTVLRGNNGLRYYTYEGTTSATGVSGLLLGNATASGTAANKYGYIQFYGTGSNYWQISGNKSISANYVLYLPTSGGCLVAATYGAAVGGTAKPVYISSSGVATALSATAGSTTQPVYLNAGTISAMTGALAVTYGGTGNTTGTATYATTTADTSSTIYPVGVTSAATTALKRDTSITMAGGTITATTFSGNATTATTWQTARTLTIGSTGKTVNGSANVSWTLSEIGAASSSHTHTTSVSWTAGTSAGPTLSVTAGGTSATAVIPSASSSASGIITTGSQTIAGAKTFSSAIYMSSTSKGYYLVDSAGNKYGGVYDNGSNLWIGATQGATPHHVGGTYISTGYNSTNSAGNVCLLCSIPNSDNTGSAGSYAIAICSGSALPTASRAIVTNSSQRLTTSATTATELGYLSGVTSSVQTQIDNKLSLSGGTVTGRTYFNQGTSVYNLGGGTGTTGYLHVCTITITGTYASQAMQFTFIQRVGWYGRVTLAFSNVNSTDPTLSYLKYQGYNLVPYIIKSDTSTWDLYVKKAEAYDNVDVVEFYQGNYQAGKVTVEWNGETVETLPDGYTEGTKELLTVNVSGYATSIYGVTTNPTESTTYNMVFTNGASGGLTPRMNNGLRYNTLEGTADEKGYARIYLGNSIASGTAANKYSGILMYGSGANYWYLSGDKAITANYTIYFPSASGGLVVSTYGSAVGSTTRPVYISSSGVATAMTGALATTYGGTGTTTGHIAVTAGTNSSPTSTLSHSGTFTAITGITKDSYGHVTAVATTTYTLPSAESSTDTKVTQTLTSSSYSYPVLLAPTGQTATTTTTAYFGTGLQFNPYTNTLTTTTFSGSLSGTATRATYLGSSTVGSGTKPIYLSSGSPTASSSTVGSGTNPMYLSSGTMTASTSTVGTSSRPVYLNGGTLTAMSDALATTYGGTGNTTGTAKYVATTDLSTNSYSYNCYITGITTQNGTHYYDTSCYFSNGYSTVATTSGYAIIALGNSTANGTVGNKYGAIQLYGYSSYYWKITGQNSTTITANRTMSLPAVTGDGWLVGTSTSSSVGASTGVYISSSGVATALSSSDERKKNVLEIDSRYLNLFMKLAPVAFTWKEGTDEYKDDMGNRVHLGLIAQQVKECMDEVGLDNDELCAFIYDEEDDSYHLAYQQLDTLTMLMVQKHEKTLEELQAQVVDLQSQITVLQAQQASA